MWGDVWTVVWREWRQHRSPLDEPRRLILGIGATGALIVGVELAFGVHEYLTAAHPALLIWIWCWLPLGTAVTLSTDAIAGDRERHTLETLLATRLPERSILVGKALAITANAWLSALALAFGALAALNTVTVWNGTLVLYPPRVLILGPLVSLLLTLFGTLAAILVSMGAPTVRQANLRILIVTTTLPILLVVPVVAVTVLIVVAFTMLTEITALNASAELMPSGPVLSIAVIAGTVTAMAFAVALVYAIAAARFTRQRLMRPIISGTGVLQLTEHGDASDTRIPTEASRRSLYLSDDRAPTPEEHEAALVTVLRDARAVAWKELAEVRALAREWRSWLIIATILIGSMVLQVSTIGGWLWAQGPAFSLLFWLAMAAALPVLIAQRAADAVAGERERYTGEILFTTRLSDGGILVGKLVVVGLLPWTIALGVPIAGFVVTNAVYAADGPHFYPLRVLIAGTALTLSVAIAFASAGMLLSAGAPTVQHAARRISWFLMPIFIAPALAYRSSLWPSSTDIRHGTPPDTGLAGMLGSGEILRTVLVGLPFLLMATAILVMVLWRRFARGAIVFN